MKRSERFIFKNFLGRLYMRNGYRVDYALKGRKHQLFLIPHVSGEEAKKVFERYRGFLASENQVLSSLEEPDCRGFAVKGKNEYVFQYSTFVGGILNPSGFTEAGTNMDELVRKLKKR